VSSAPAGARARSPAPAPAPRGQRPAHIPPRRAPRPRPPPARRPAPPLAPASGPRPRGATPPRPCRAVAGGAADALGGLLAERFGAGDGDGPAAGGAPAAPCEVRYVLVGGKEVTARSKLALVVCEPGAAVDPLLVARHCGESRRGGAVLGPAEGAAALARLGGGDRVRVLVGRGLAGKSPALALPASSGVLTCSLDQLTCLPGAMVVPVGRGDAEGGEGREAAGAAGAEPAAAGA